MSRLVLMFAVGLLCGALIVSVSGASVMGATAQSATPAPGEVTIQGTIMAKGRFIFSWVRDDLCTLAFWDYDFTPELIVTDSAGVQLAALPLEELPGTVTMSTEGGQEHAEICTVPYRLTVPASDAYRVEIAPYYESDELTAADLASDLDISFERQMDDPAPDFRDRPAGPIPGTDLFRIAGTFELLADPDDLSFMAIPIGGCVAFGGYDDIQAGAQITVKDQTGTIIGIGELEPIYTVDGDRCVFVFSLDVPEATFYTLEMGRRGEQAYSRQDLEQAGWRVDLSIGP